MQALLNFIGPVFWGLVTLSALVFLHEGGHFLAARACGVRVTEFFLGMPCRFNLHHVSRRIGTKFGITPILLGGYAAICGMDPSDPGCAPRVLSYVHARGKASVKDIAHDLDVSEDDALDACVLLMGWGSIAPVYDTEKGENSNSGYYPSTYAGMPRDHEGNTVFDGRRFQRALATAEGEPWEPTMGESTFFEQERSRTYIGKGFWKRALMLVAGIAVNILTGLLLMMSVYSIVGVQSAVNLNEIGSVDAGSPAEKSGLMAGDRIVSVAGVAASTWEDVVAALTSHNPGEKVELVIQTSDTSSQASPKTVQVTLDAHGAIGIRIPTRTVRLNPIDSARIAIDYIGQTAQMVGNLINPQHTMEVLDNSTSVVGISMMSAQAAAAGPATFLNFAALISFSLGFMNLLPIPPLDGGKLLIEIIQAIARRQVPLKVQNWLSVAGVVLFGALFIYMLRSDILRFFL